MAGGAARISEIVKFSCTKNPESAFCFIKNPNLTKKKNLAGGRGWCMARVSDLFFFKSIQI